MVSRILTIILVLLILSCEEEVFDNLLDPEGDNFIAPETTITTEDLDGGVINTSSININWEGNELVTDYNINLNDQGWGGWTVSTDSTFTYLDEGYHNFKVKSRYTNGLEDDTPAELNFEVDAVTGPGLRIYPLYTDLIPNNSNSISIYVEDIENISFGTIVFESSPRIFV